MTIRRSPSSASRTMARYLSSKTWRGATVRGNSTKSGSGNTGTGFCGASSKRTSRGSILPDELEQRGDVAVDLHLGIDLGDPPSAVDHERRALDTHVLLAV